VLLPPLPPVPPLLPVPPVPPQQPRRLVMHGVALRRVPAAVAGCRQRRDLTYLGRRGGA